MEFEPISNDDVRKGFDEFSVLIEDDQVLSKLKELCLLYVLDVETLAIQWIAFANAKKLAAVPNLVSLEQFQREQIHRKAIAVQTEKLAAKPAAKRAVNSAADGLAFLDEYGDESFSRPDQIPEPVQLDNSEEESLGVSCLAYFGESITNWINRSGKRFYNELIINSEQSLQPYKFLQINLHAIQEMLDQQVQQTLAKLDSHNVSSDDQHSEENEEQYFIGHLVGEPLNEKQSKLNEQTLALQYGSRRIKLNFSALSSYSLFPGQVISVKTRTNAERELLVEEIVSPDVTINQFPLKQINLRKPLHLVAAAGPYFLPNSDDLTPLKSLLKYVQQTNANVLVLFGPFVDERNERLLDPDQLFEGILEEINSLKLSFTQVVIVPSTRDLHHQPTYPTPPFAVEEKFNNIMFVANPCLLDINGIVVALNAEDVLMHLSKSELRKVSGADQTTERMKNVCRHILSQQSFYPLYPPELNLSFSHHEHLRLPVTPHLFLLSSDLKHFIKNVNGCVFLNSERLSKGVFSRVIIEPIDAGFTGSIWKFVNAEIVKL